MSPPLPRAISRGHRALGAAPRDRRRPVEIAPPRGLICDLTERLLLGRPQNASSLAYALKEYLFVSPRHLMSLSYNRNVEDNA